MNIISELNGKRILIWGYGREGKSTERFLRSHCPGASYEIYEGAGEGINFDSCDIVVKSPGICTQIKSEKMTSQTELFLAQFGDRTIGITGTKGKSTTSKLLYSTLRSRYGDRVILVGNIGLPCLDSYDVIDEDTIIVYELSCHQLNNCKYSPHIAVFLNLFEDHLDYYGTRENYFRAKSAIAKHQTEGDYYIHGEGVPFIPTKAESIIAPEIGGREYDIPLLGRHNQYNANVVYMIASRFYGMEDGEIRRAFSTFKGLSHRLELIGRVGGASFYDDSISTIPEATVQAIQSIPNVKSVIIGGMDRNIDYTFLIDFIREYTDIIYIFAYASGRRIYKEVAELECCELVTDLEEAVRRAKEVTRPGEACILSPAAASYGYFKNFEERGDVFKRLVLSERGVTVAFTGDIGFDKYLAEGWRDDELLSGGIREFLGSADHVAANVEGPLMETPAESESSGNAQLKHCMSAEVAPFLTGIGADIWSLCNNHIMDAGAEGLESTLNAAKSVGARTVGAGMDIAEARKPVILEGAGGVGMIAVGYQRACRPAGENAPGCYRWDDLEAIAESVKEIKKTCRWCVIVAHGGEEFTPLPSPYTRDKYLKYLELGADIVVCHHPHVPMNYEKVGDKTIFYSLGNFIFDTDYQRSQHYTDTGVLLKISFTETNYTFEAMGIRIERGRERIAEAPLPDIFQNVDAEEYSRLLPLSVKAFIEASKRQLDFLRPEEFRGAGQEKYYADFMKPMRSGRVPGETLDFQILLPIAERADEGEWKKSKNERIVRYILNQLESVKGDA